MFLISSQVIPLLPGTLRSMVLWLLSSTAIAVSFQNVSSNSIDINVGFDLFFVVKACWIIHQFLFLELVWADRKERVASLEEVRFLNKDYYTVSPNPAGKTESVQALSNPCL